MFEVSVRPEIQCTEIPAPCPPPALGDRRTDDPDDTFTRSTRLVQGVPRPARYHFEGNFRNNPIPQGVGQSHTGLGRRTELKTLRPPFLDVMVVAIRMGRARRGQPSVKKKLASTAVHRGVGSLGRQGRLPWLPPGSNRNSG